MPVAQGGANVSGGQRQRLAIARAVIRRPAIYLFDDTFSALDVHTDARIRAALCDFAGAATILVVSQRIATVLAADQVVVLDAGRVVGTGTHESLVATCPAYADFVDSQTAGTAAGGRS
jgi:ABC-type multidrug transport system fused ATPase/permease subunit